MLGTDDAYVCAQAFMDTVCAKCAWRQLDCQCDLGLQHPTFQALYTYAHAYTTFVEFMRLQTAAGRKEAMDHPRWVLVRAKSGAGNQLIEIMSALMFAMALDRGLIVDWASDERYTFDPVIDFIQFSHVMEALDLSSADWFNMSTSNASHLDLFMCGDWDSVLGERKIIWFDSVLQPYLAFPNSFRGSWLKHTFQDKAFFFLSHYIWSGIKERDSKVDVLSMPKARHWDGARKLSHVLNDIRSQRNSSIIVGMQVRAVSKPSYSYMDNLHLFESFHLQWCDGHPTSLDPMFHCVETLAQNNKNKPNVIVLWATDNDDLSVRLLAKLVKISTVVKIKYASVDRHDIYCSQAGGQVCEDTGLLDLEFLGGADHMVVTPQSTFSFAAHARALIKPHFGIFHQGSCDESAGSEVGLILREKRNFLSELKPRSRRCSPHENAGTCSSDTTQRADCIFHFLKTQECLQVH
jgi:hypothetical protein